VEGIPATEKSSQTDIVSLFKKSQKKTKTKKRDALNLLRRWLIFCFRRMASMPHRFCLPRFFLLLALRGRVASAKESAKKKL